MGKSFGGELNFEEWGAHKEKVGDCMTMQTQRIINWEGQQHVGRNNDMKHSSYLLNVYCTQDIVLVAGYRNKGTKPLPS